MNLVTLSLATYLVATTIARLHGPLGLAERLRHAVYRWRGFRPAPNGDWYDQTRPHPAQPRILEIEDDWITAGISCPICLAPYVAAALLLAPAPLLSWLAAAGAAAAIFKVAHR